ncbi:VWA domain-containing protein [Lentisphaerota bacterium WC36G]|nr:VWA domain-containing protein [Lentisphaerae bacterium WC36]
MKDFSIAQICQALPLVAGVLGQRYGVEVTIGGNTAYTDGKRINLPSLPVECDEVLMHLIRGWVDHESAHIRHTNFELIKGKRLSDLEKNILNIFEDWRVERELSNQYIGCKNNFAWLVDYYFNKDVDLSSKQSNDAKLIVNYILLKVRSFTVTEVGVHAENLRSFLESHFSNVLTEIDKIIQSMKANANSTQDCLKYAKKVTALLRKLIKSDAESKATKKQLEKLLKAKSGDLPKDFAGKIQGELEAKAPNHSNSLVQSSRAVENKAKAFDSEMLNKGNTTANQLRRYFCNLLQAKDLQRVRESSYGHKINVKKLAKAPFNCKLFLKDAEKIKSNTAVHLLLDCSLSMRDDIELASLSCYSIAKALHGLNNISVGVTAFPVFVPESSDNYVVNVSQILKHDERMHNNFNIKVCGSTPMGAALWSVLQAFYQRRENRKIIFIITDGEPDEIDNVKLTLKAAEKLNIEVYGIGIKDTHIKDILPQNSKIIHNLTDLTSTIKTLLKKSLI